jgi:hypothetical protein
MGTGGSFPGDKVRPGRDADHSPPSSAVVKNEQKLCLLTPHLPPRRVAGQLYFLLYFYFFNYGNKIASNYLRDCEWWRTKGVQTVIANFYLRYPVETVKKTRKPDRIARRDTPGCETGDRQVLEREGGTSDTMFDGTCRCCNRSRLRA